MWKNYYNVTTVVEALQVLAEKGEQARIIAGGTDLILELERKVRTGVDTLVDISRIPGLDRIVLDEKDVIHLGPLVTHNQCVASKLIRECALPLAKAAWEVGAPQIRNRGTVAGNLITASPANDTIPPLIALGAEVTLRSKNCERKLLLQDFYRGVRQTVMNPDELLVDISFKAIQFNQRGTFIKLGLRLAQAISLVNTAVMLTMEDDAQSSSKNALIKQAVITLGAVAPTIIHAEHAEQYLQGKRLNEETILQAAALSKRSATPIDDVRGSADYRAEMVQVCTRRALRAIATSQEGVGLPEQPIFLWGKNEQAGRSSLEHIQHDRQTPIQTKINGKNYVLPGAGYKTLLRLIREDAGLTGTKEGCAEGECGACTVFLDGVAVMSCLVPAPRAHQACITTIEGLAAGEHLHPVQQAFIEEGAVQCGYCTPGFIMSAVKLLEEQPHPTIDQVKQSITGNLCRCTGYYSIIRAIETAAQKEAASV